MMCTCNFFNVIWMTATITLSLAANLAPRISTAANPNVVIRSLSENPGIYFEKLHDLRFSEDNWKIAVYLDFDKFIFNYTYFKEKADHMYSTCEHDFYVKDCIQIKKMVQQANIKINKTQNKFNDLMTYIGELKNYIRPEIPNSKLIFKRNSLYSFFGKITKEFLGSFAGSLSEYATNYYSNKIKQQSQGELKLADLYKEQIHILRHELNITRKDIASIKNEVDHFITDSKKRWNTFIKNEVAIDVIDYTNSVSFGLHLLESSLDWYSQSFETMMDIIISARHGNLHPSLLKKEQLQGIIRQITDMHPNYEFPVPIAEARPENLVDVAVIRLGYVINKFIAEVKIPLLDKYPTELYRMHPLPIPQILQNNKRGAAYVKPQSTYIAVTHDRRAYTFLSDNELNNCKMTYNHLICKHETPIFDGGYKEDCEYLLLNEPSENSLNKCDIHIHNKQQTYWMRLSSIDGWLYSIPMEQKLQIHCPGQQSDLVDINEIGIIQLKPRCTAKQGRTTLMGGATFESSEQHIYSPQLHLNIQMFLKNRSTEEKKIFQQLDYEQQMKILDDDISLKEIDERYDNIVKEVQANEKDIIIYFMGFGINFFIMLLIISIKILIIIKCYVDKKYFKKYRSVSADEEFDEKS